MDAQKEKSVKSLLPVWTLVVLGGAIVSFIFPEVSSWLVYDRAAILNGQIWRILTSHLVHFDKAPLVYDLIAFGVTGWILESKGRGLFCLSCALMALSIGIFLVGVETSMAYYGGLSGLAIGLLTYLALDGLGDLKPWRVLCRLVVFFVPLKIVLEAYTGGSVLLFTASSAFVPIWESHAMGSLTALSIFLAKKIFRNGSTMVSGMPAKANGTACQ